MGEVEKGNEKESEQKDNREKQMVTMNTSMMYCMCTVFLVVICNAGNALGIEGVTVIVSALKKTPRLTSINLRSEWKSQTDVCCDGRYH